MIPDREFTRRLVQTVATIAGAIVLAAALYAARGGLMLIYISALIAMGFSPLVNVIQRRSGNGRTRVPRTLAILGIYLVVVGLIIAVGLAIVPPLIAQGESLWANVPKMFDDFQRFLIRYRLMGRRVTLQEAVQNAPAGTGGNAVTTVLIALSGVVGGVFGVVTVIILSFYFLIEAEPLLGYLMRFVPKGSRTRVSTVAREAVAKVSAWLRAQIVLAGVMGTFAAVGLGLLGEPYFYVVSLIAAVGETIPIVGPIIAGVVAVGVAFGTSPQLALEVGLLFLGLHELEANVLVPKIMEKGVGVSPVAVIVALLVGGEIFGLIGAILAIPTTAILGALIDEFSSHRESML